MIAHAGTPPFQFYVMPKGLDRDMYVGTSVLFFAATNLMKAPAFLALGQLSLSQPKTTLIFFPLAMASSWLGSPPGQDDRRSEVQFYHYADPAVRRARTRRPKMQDFGILRADLRKFDRIERWYNPKTKSTS